MRNKSGYTGIHSNGKLGWYINLIVETPRGVTIRRKSFKHIEDAVRFKRDNKDLVKL